MLYVMTLPQAIASTSTRQNPRTSLYPVFTTNVLQANDTLMATFADATAIMLTDTDSTNASDKL